MFSRCLLGQQRYVFMKKNISFITKLRILLTSKLPRWCFSNGSPSLPTVSPSPSPPTPSELLQSWIPGSHLGLKGSVSVRSKLITPSNTLLTQCSNELKGMGQSQLLLCSSFCCSGYCTRHSCQIAALVLAHCQSAVAVFWTGLRAKFWESWAKSTSWRLESSY